MTRLHVVLISLLALLLLPAAGCPVKPAPTPCVGGAFSTGGTVAAGGTQSDAGAPSAGQAGATSVSRCQRACAAYVRFGCPEDQSTCVAQCEIMISDSRFTFDVDCRINATSKAAIQACGIGSCK